MCKVEVPRSKMTITFDYFRYYNNFIHSSVRMINTELFRFYFPFCYSTTTSWTTLNEFLIVSPATTTVYVDGLVAGRIPPARGLLALIIILHYTSLILINYAEIVAVGVAAITVSYEFIVKVGRRKTSHRPRPSKKTATSVHLPHHCRTWTK